MMIRLGLGGLGVMLWGDDRVVAAPVSDLALCKDAAEKIRPLFEKKKLIVAGDWLAYHDEPGQTFEQFLKLYPARGIPSKRKLYIQPIGGFNEAEMSVLKQLREFLRIFFGMEVVELAAIPLNKIPQSARRKAGQSDVEQILTTYAMEQLILPVRRKDAAAVIGITAADLWPGEGWNFVFGMASTEERLGIWSMHRFGDPVKNPTSFLRRVLQVAIHETGHMLGIEHCTAYECCMNGSNSLQESDRASMVFCPECDPKLWWSCGLDPAARAEALAAFSKRHALDREATQWQRVADALHPH